MQRDALGESSEVGPTSRLSSDMEPMHSMKATPGTSPRVPVGGVREPIGPDALSDTADSNESAVTVAEVIELLGDDWLTRNHETGLELTSATGDLLGGQPHGDWVVRWTNRKWTEKGRYVLGARHGTWKLYDENGELIRVATYFGGRRNGPLRDRDDAQSPWRHYEYLNGERLE